ncbi:ABC transporter substrate-binding protein [Bradyrhizobium sp.]|jgi:putative spermidine/putrescine transport system substrate-binding protein|uniref:ABC transporter substrate-binding protein n=1 Tax=Bradyrhizobium sp. TaxID=376 RepID=UPI002C5D2971|nr:ABC transporter substrate-binding protein [Bradyrhizobium sp.]HWX63038.1 ABC transporter substrate-binding protein [Bradyrhizobium sp.]
MTRVCRTALIALTTAAIISPLKSANAEELTVMATGGAWQAALRQAWFEPFAKKANVKLNEQEYTGELGKIKAMVETGNVPIDLVTVETSTVLQGCDAGVLIRLDYSKIAERSKFLPGTALDCGVGIDVYGDVLAYDTTVLKDAPTSVLDIFDTKTFPGKRAMRKAPAQNLEWALMADGVPVTEVYKVLATPEGVDRAFKKLDSIKKDIVWWEAGAQPPQLLASKEVVMTTAWNGRIQNAIDQDKRPFALVWNNQIVEYDMIAIPKGAKNLDVAYKYLAYAAEPEVSAQLGRFIPYGPVRADATPFVPKEVLAKLPTAPDHMKTYLVSDVEFWGDQGEDLVKRFNAWLAQ